MNVFAHVSCGFPALLYANGRPAGGAVPAGKPVHIELDEGETLALTAAPLSDAGGSVKLLPASCVLNIRGGGAFLSGRGETLELPRNHFEVFIPPEKLCSYVPPTPLAQTDFSINGEKHCVTIFRDALTQALIEGGGRVFGHVLPSGYEHGDIRGVSLPDGGAETTIRGRARGREYMAVIASRGGGYAVELELSPDKLETEGDEIQTLTYARDIAGRGFVEKYARGADGRFNRSDRYAVYLFDGAKKPGNPRLIPYALFEAVKAGDTAEARALLSDGLNSEVSDDGALAGFFEAYSEMRENLYYPDLPDAVLVRAKRRCDLMEFSVSNGKIDDMRIL